MLDKSVKRVMNLRGTGSKAVIAPDLGALARFLPTLRDLHGPHGYWVEASSTQMPYCLMSTLAEELVQTCYTAGWVRVDFDWREWMATERANELLQEADALAGATSAELAQLLTVIIRQDRFIEGSLLEHFSNGLILGIVRRAAILATAEAGGVGELRHLPVTLYGQN